MLAPSWQPGIVYYVDLGGIAEIRIVPDPGVSQVIPCPEGSLNVYGQIGAPLQGLIFSRSRVVRGYGWLGDSAG